MTNKKLFLFVIFLIILSACTAGETAVQPAPTAAAILATDTAVPPTNTPPPTITPQPEIALEAGDPARGQVIFENGGAHEAFEPSYYCVHCHSLDGSDGDGPTLQGIAMAAGERVPGLTAEEYIRQSIMEPDAYVVEGYDHSMGRIFSKLLSEQEVHDLVAFLLTLSGDAVTAQPNP